MSEDPRTETVADDGEGSTDRAESDGAMDRADRWQEKLAIPVLVAALASVPAVFLTLFDDPMATVGSTINMASGAVLVAEAVVLFAVSDQRLRWLRRNWWLAALAVIIVPAVIYAVAPVQLLRVLYVLRAVGALRIIRVKRIFKAGAILRKRAGLNRWWQRTIGVLVTGLIAVFVALVLADPSSQSRQLLDGAIDRLGWVGIVVAGLLLAGATWVVLHYRNDGEAAGDDDSEDDVSAEWHAPPAADRPADGGAQPGRTNADVAAGSEPGRDRGHDGPDSPAG